jgi:hypothetical protein
MAGLKSDFVVFGTNCAHGHVGFPSRPSDRKTLDKLRINNCLRPLFRHELGSDGRTRTPSYPFLQHKKVP